MATYSPTTMMTLGVLPPAVLGLRTFGSLQLAEEYHYDQVREGDSLCLQLLIWAGIREPKILICLNWVRKYKGIMHVLDTTSYNG